MRRQDLSVRRLAEFLWAQGDLHVRVAGRHVEPEEGIAAQKRCQNEVQERFPAYLREFALNTHFEVDGLQLKLSGRVDGLMRGELPLTTHQTARNRVSKDGDGGASVVFEEYKCVGLLPDEPHPIDMGQACLYAWLYAVQFELDADAVLDARLIYVEVDTDRSRTFVRHFTPQQAQGALALALLCYDARMRRHLERTKARVAWQDSLEFPYVSFRPGQRAIAERVYLALRDGENLLLEAPTGSGKSIATLFPAVKVLGPEQQVFFLTSRNMGAQAAQSALTLIDPSSEHVVSVEIIAKQKACPLEGTPCDPEICQYAAGYFDRAGAAVEAVLEARLASSDVIARVAETHVVCPFELSLDAASWADVVVGDYNYIFDPVVALHRFAEHPQMHLLIDESHQLSARARDMLSVKISRQALPRLHTHPVIRKGLKAIDRALLKLAKDAPEGDSVVEDVAGVQRALTRFMETLAELPEHERNLSEDEVLREVVYLISRWRRSDAWYDPASFHHRLTVGGAAPGAANKRGMKRQIELARVCVDPARYVNERIEAYHSTIRFSGTVSPLPLYQRLHGALAHSAAERAPSPFSGEEAAVLVVPDVPTYYRSRAQSMPKLRQLITDLVETRKGRYLVALPSYDYLSQLAIALESLDILVLRQTPGQLSSDAESLLDEFRAADAAILCIVMGGILGESVDFADIRLAGVVLVGLGLPPPSLDRELMRDHFGDEMGPQAGEIAAYLQPALVKVVQAAGRLVRSADDRGVICLVDPRFANREVQRFFPTHWRPQTTTAKQLKSTVSAFWQDKYDHAERTTSPS